MHMIIHQAIGPYLHLIALRALDEPMDVGLTVLRFQENVPATITSVGNVVGIPRYYDSC
jgi:hypothetical protein